MPSAIPDRYSLEVRLGRDGDVEEWLATDDSLDRPVLVRSLGPESSGNRRRQFVHAVSHAAKATHSHLVRVFAVAESDGGAYAVLEWTGGATLADRVDAGRPVELQDFLPNATGVAGALAALHDQGGVHGRIDTSALSYSGGHPAKLGAFGRTSKGDPESDVRALSGALETALTGAAPGGPPPSETIDGVPAELDQVLRRGQSGDLTAAELEKALRATPTPRAPKPQESLSSRRLLLTALGLVLLAVLLITTGFLFSGGSTQVVPVPTTESSPTTTSVPAPPTSAVSGSPQITGVQTLDPFGGGGENDQLLPNLTDGDSTTEWHTETYLDPLQSVKPGVGITIATQGSPRSIELVRMTRGTEFQVLWSPSRFEDPLSWTPVAAATAGPGTTTIGLPSRQNGYWLIWLLDLPEADDGSYRTSIAEVRFRQ